MQVLRKIEHFQSEEDVGLVDGLVHYTRDFIWHQKMKQNEIKSIIFLSAYLFPYYHKNQAISVILTEQNIISGYYVTFYIFSYILRTLPQSLSE